MGPPLLALFAAHHHSFWAHPRASLPLPKAALLCFWLEGSPATTSRAGSAPWGSQASSRLDTKLHRYALTACKKIINKIKKNLLLLRLSRIKQRPGEQSSLQPLSRITAHPSCGIDLPLSLPTPALRGSPPRFVLAGGEQRGTGWGRRRDEDANQSRDAWKGFSGDEGASKTPLIIP